jgi:hypothetical protein
VIGAGQGHVDRRLEHMNRECTPSRRGFRRTCEQVGKPGPRDQWLVHGLTPSGSGHAITIHARNLARPLWTAEQAAYSSRADAAR